VERAIVITVCHNRRQAEHVTFSARVVAIFGNSVSVLVIINTVCNSVPVIVRKTVVNGAVAVVVETVAYFGLVVVTKAHDIQAVLGAHPNAVLAVVRIGAVAGQPQLGPGLVSCAIAIVVHSVAGFEPGRVSHALGVSAVLTALQRSKGAQIVIVRGVTQIPQAQVYLVNKVVAVVVFAITKLVARDGGRALPAGDSLAYVLGTARPILVLIGAWRRDQALVVLAVAVVVRAVANLLDWLRCRALCPTVRTGTGLGAETLTEFVLDRTGSLTTVNVSNTYARVSLWPALKSVFPFMVNALALIVLWTIRIRAATD